jgi:hypothetical protein
MGTDIHMYVEKKIGKEWKADHTIECWSDRNYNMFAMLADIRNGRGFAGIRTGSGYEPIAAPRGEPSDLSSYVRENKTWDHTPTWLTLAEILAAEESGYFEKTTDHVGAVPLTAGDDAMPFGKADNYVDWKERGGGWPHSWSGSVSGKSISNITAEEADKLIAGGYKAAPPSDHAATRYFVTVGWKAKYRDSAESFLAWVRDDLMPLAEKHGAQNVRLVFGFDS